MRTCERARKRKQNSNFGTFNCVSLPRFDFFFFLRRCEANQKDDNMRSSSNEMNNGMVQARNDVSAEDDKEERKMSSDRTSTIVEIMKGPTAS